ncbi:MAG: thioredoxin family protein [Planctomycetota bacterium]
MARISICFGLTAFALSLAFAPASGHAADAPAGWQTDIYAAHQASLKTGKPMVVVVGAEWCHFCKKLENETLVDPTMAGYIGANFVPVHLDFDQNKPIAKVLEIQSIPSTVILSPEADLLGRVDGFQVPRDYWERLEDARELHSKVSPAGYTAPAE